MDINARIKESRLEFGCQINGFVIPLIEFFRIAECADAFTIGTQTPLGTCALGFLMECVIVEVKFKPVFFGIVFDSIETAEEEFCFLYVFIAGVNMLTNPVTGSILLVFQAGI